MANTSALKKGAPPTREDTPPLVQANPRSFEGKKKPIQGDGATGGVSRFQRQGRSGIWLHERLEVPTLPCHVESL